MTHTWTEDLSLVTIHPGTRGEDVVAPAFKRVAPYDLATWVSSFGIYVPLEDLYANPMFHLASLLDLICDTNEVFPISIRFTC